MKGLGPGSLTPNPNIANPNPHQTPNRNRNSNPYLNPNSNSGPDPHPNPNFKRDMGPGPGDAPDMNALVGEPQHHLHRPPLRQRRGGGPLPNERTRNPVLLSKAESTPARGAFQPMSCLGVSQQPFSRLRDPCLNRSSFDEEILQVDGKSKESHPAAFLPASGWTLPGGGGHRERPCSEGTLKPDTF